MPHTHEYDCIVCGAHFDSEADLAQHDRQTHAPKVEPNLASPEPMGNEHRREPDHDDD
jgi:hypothetical protein